MYLECARDRALEGRPLRAITADEQIGDRQALARTLFDTLLGEVMIDGIFHADPHPGNVLLLADGQHALLDFGSVGRADVAARCALADDKLGRNLLVRPPLATFENGGFGRNSGLPVSPF